MFFLLNLPFSLMFVVFVVTIHSSKSQGVWTKNVSDQATQVGLVTFASFGELVLPLDKYNGNKSGLLLDLRSAEYYGTGTSNRRDAPDVAVLMTDGMSSLIEADHEARLLREKGVSIVVIGVGSNLNRDLLLAIAESEQNLFLIDDFDSLLEDSSLILGRSCSAVETDFPILLDCPRLSNPIIDEDIFKFECYINYSLPVSNEARFLVQFLHDGVSNDQYSVVLSPPDTSVTLHEYFLRGHMGKYFSHEVVTVYETDNDNNTKYDNVAIDYVYSSLPILCPRDNNKCDLSLKITSIGSVAVYQSQDNGIRRCSYQ
ncbi:hypothetical protein LSH36_419g00029 [Paralvinella palmiformis]|uniref:VWFA domain-containing protein n=1 Tax=Paralvinella palmiformis TaxID=53620 RepID=A0AAD9JBM4_9ANNE|nr:hypothetical protein LSH36_419g00029 [Paralvinella palmiformis]